MTDVVDEHGAAAPAASRPSARFTVVEAYPRREVDRYIAELEARATALEEANRRAERRAADAERRVRELGWVESSFRELFAAFNTNADSALEQAREQARRTLEDAHREADEVRRAAAADAARVAEETRLALDEEYRRFEERLASELVQSGADRAVRTGRPLTGAPAELDTDLDLGSLPRTERHEPPGAPPLDLALDLPDPPDAGPAPALGAGLADEAGAGSDLGEVAQLGEPGSARAALAALTAAFVADDDEPGRAS